MAPTGTDLSLLAVLIQGGSFVLVCVLVVYVFPRWQQEHREERQRQLDYFGQIIDKIEAGFERRNENLRLALDRQTDALSKHWDSHAARVEKSIESICKAPLRHLPENRKD